jgi:hypothetical protein
MHLEACVGQHKPNSTPPDLASCTLLGAAAAAAAGSCDNLREALSRVSLQCTEVVHPTIAVLCALCRGRPNQLGCNPPPLALLHHAPVAACHLATNDLRHAVGVLQRWCCAVHTLPIPCAVHALPRQGVALLHTAHPFWHASSCSLPAATCLRPCCVSTTDFSDVRLTMCGVHGSGARAQALARLCWLAMRMDACRHA